MSSKNKMSRQKTLLGILTLLLISISLISVGSVHASADYEVAFYSFSNRNYNVYCYGEFLENDTGRSFIGESFTVDDTAYLTQIQVQLVRIGSPVGTVYCSIYNIDNFTDVVSTDYSADMLETSTDTYAAGSINTVITTYTFNFTQTTELTDGSYYLFIIYVDDASLIDWDNHIRVGQDNSASTYEGAYICYDNPSAEASFSTTIDTVFYVWGNAAPAEGETETEDYWWTSGNISNFLNLIIIIVIILIPAAILGLLFKLGTFGYATGLLIGAALGYTFYPTIVPIWLVFAVLIGIIGLMLFGRRSK